MGRGTGLIARLAADRSGVAAAEYALLLGLLIGSVVIGAWALGQSISNAMDDSAALFASYSGSATPGSSSSSGPSSGSSAAGGSGSSPTSPGNSGNAPGQNGTTPGQSGATPANGSAPPGQSGATPGQSKKNN
ncbi:hypothetical protein [Sphingobium sp. Sx8-8]|uniref:hypothetical protein n=1 Tax=Sphingobium sp. Sx8-8 TaxID=2933617 RepID=UPI001F5ABBB6|nr:hypothetical protein [Sphingobium sp. Sx8-8]